MTQTANRFTTEYLCFEEVNDTGKTKVWEVTSRSIGELLGVIKWFSPWRQYTFWPESETIWNRGCLQDIQDFIGEEMEARKAHKQ